MDVARRDDDLARALVRGYRAAGGDPLLSFLCSIRALVRAKVDLRRAGQLSGAAADERSARGYELLTLAERFAWRALLQRVAGDRGRRRAVRLSRGRAAVAATMLGSVTSGLVHAGVLPGLVVPSPGSPG